MKDNMQSFLHRLVPARAVRARNAVAIAMLLLAGPAYADSWSIRNGSPYDVWAAVAYDRNGTLVSKGWYRLRSCGGTARVASDISKRGAFVFAKEVGSGRRASRGSNSYFCVRDDAFEIRIGNVDRAECARTGGRFEDFELVTVDPSNRTTTISGKRFDNRTCID
jgi:uncharacterized membrane protein